MIKKIVALLLSASLALSMVTTSVFAVNESNKDLEYLRAAQRLVNQFSLDDIYNGSNKVVNGIYTIETKFPLFEGLLYSKTKTGENYLDTTTLNESISILSLAVSQYKNTATRSSFLGYTNKDGEFTFSSFSILLNIEGAMEYKKANEVAQAVANDIKSKTSSKTEMVKLANSFLVDTVVYPDVINKNDRSIYTAYGALINKKAVCEGYSMAFGLIMKKLDIPSVNVPGTSEGSSHMWNEVYIDGVWLCVDTTYNDPKLLGNGWTSKQKALVKEKYLLVTRDKFYSTKQHVQTYANYIEQAKDIFYRECVVNEANILKSKNLFMGDSTGFRLKDSLTRAEMAVMLTRVVGAEKEVNDKIDYYKSKCSFTDVPDWAKAYVGYCVEKGLVKGIGNGLYGSNNIATKLDYCTVMLRATNVKDGYTYNTSDAKAVELGYLSLPRSAFAELSRGDVVHITYNMYMKGLI